MMVAGAPFSEMTRPMIRRIGLKPAAPEAVGNEDGTRALDILRRERPPERRPDAEHVEEVRADAHAVDPLRVAGAREVESLRSDPGKPFERGVLRPEVGDVARRGRQRIESDPLLDLGAVLPRHHEPIGARIRQWLKQDAVDDAEDRRVAADPERQGHDRDCGESRSARQCANGRADILHLLLNG